MLQIQFKMTIKEPITGKETIKDNSSLAALSQFYNAFNNGNMELMEKNWSNATETAMDNPLGGIKRGWQDIKQVYENIFNGQAEVYVEFYDYTLRQFEEVFYVVGRERGFFKVGDTTIDLAIRTSRIFKKENGAWKQTHHHGSIENPDLLKTYQELVRK